MAEPSCFRTSKYLPASSHGFRKITNTNINSTDTDSVALQFVVKKVECVFKPTHIQPFTNDFVLEGNCKIYRARESLQTQAPPDYFYKPARNHPLNALCPFTSQTNCWHVFNRNALENVRSNLKQTVR